MMMWKGDNVQPCTLYPMDVVPLMNKIFHKSYDDIHANLKSAVSDCGWYPANRKLLEHKALFNDTVANPTDTAASPDTPTRAIESVTSTTSTSTVNIETGKGEIMLDRMITERARSAAGKKAAEGCKRNSDLITQNLQNAKNSPLEYCHPMVCIR